MGSKTYMEIHKEDAFVLKVELPHTWRILEGGVKQKRRQNERKNGV